MSTRQTADGIPLHPAEGVEPARMTMAQVFDDEQVKAREMVIEMDHPATGSAPAKLIASPIKMSGTPVRYRHAPPMLGQHTEEVLGEILNLSEAEVAALREKRVL